jgi:hypothetical protein
MPAVTAMHKKDDSKFCKVDLSPAVVMSNRRVSTYIQHGLCCDSLYTTDKKKEGEYVCMVVVDDDDLLVVVYYY